MQDFIPRCFGHVASASCYNIMKCLGDLQKNHLVLQTWFKVSQDSEKNFPGDISETVGLIGAKLCQKDPIFARSMYRRMLQIDPSAFRPLFATIKIFPTRKSINHARIASYIFETLTGSTIRSCTEICTTWSEHFSHTFLQHFRKILL